MAALTESKAGQRPLGIPKAGLRVTWHDHAGRRQYRGRADPVLLALVVGTALALAAGGAIAASPQLGAIGSLTFALLFSPLIAFVIFGTVALRTSCVIDRAQSSLQVRERGYVTGFESLFALSEIRGVGVVMEPDVPLVGTSDRYRVCILLTQGCYEVLASSTERRAILEAESLAIFLGVRLMPIANGQDELEAVRGRLPFRALLISVVVFVAPTLVTALALFALFGNQPPTQRLMLTSLGAIVASQVGAILAFAYNRARLQRAW